METTPVHHTEAALLDSLQRLLALPTLSLLETLDAVADQLAATFQADKVDTFLHEEEEHLLVARGTSNTPMGRLQRELNLHRLPIAQGGRVIEVWQSGAPYLTGHADEDPEIDRGTREALGVRSAMMVPLAHEGGCFGVLSVMSAREGYFTPEALAVLEAIARWVSMVAQRAALVEQLRAGSVREARRAVAEEILMVLAHDLGNYLLPLQARVHSLHRRAVREGRTRDVQDASEGRLALTHLTALVRSLLDSARLTQGLFKPSPTLHDLGALILELATVLSPDRSRIEVDAPEPLVILGDEGQLRQLLTNLLINALQHSPVGAAVRVRAHCEELEGHDWALVTVHNAGRPIDPALLPELFELFTSANNSTGRGIGLYIARQIALQHGGSLTVASDAAAGTTFSLAIPFAPELPFPTRLELPVASHYAKQSPEA